MVVDGVRRKRQVRDLRLLKILGLKARTVSLPIPAESETGWSHTQLKHHPKVVTPLSLFPIFSCSYTVDRTANLSHSAEIPVPSEKKTLHTPSLTPVLHPNNKKWLHPPKSKEARLLRNRKKEKSSKDPYNFSEDVCRISPSEAESAKNYGNRIKELKHLLSIKYMGSMMWKTLINLPKQKEFS